MRGHEGHHDQMMQLLSDPKKRRQEFVRVKFELCFAII